MRRFWAQPLRRQLLIIILLQLVPIIAAVIWAGLATLEEHTDELAADARTIATATSLYVARDIEQLVPSEVEKAGGVSSKEAAVLAMERVTSRLYARLPMPDGLAIVIASRDGEELARSVRGTPPVGAFGPSRLYAESAVDGTAWVVKVELPFGLAIERASSIWARSAAIFGGGVALWLCITYVMVQRFTTSVGHLDRTAKRIAEGDFSTLERKPMPSREFAELQDAFDAMITRLKESRLALDAQMTEERQIRTELESLQGQVIRQERLAAVGQLVSGVAHEINNPLQAILGFAELLQMEDNVPDSAKSDLRLIQKESARACAIIRNLALFARQQTEAACPVRLVDVIGSVAELRQRRLESEDIELRVDDQSRKQVMAVATELQQVILNFVVNAEHAVVASGRLPGRITVRTSDRAGEVVLEVEDTGPGVAPENESKLFQPFFTTKPVGQGTGLGLSVSYGIVESLGGQIGYRRAPAGGAIFYFALPAVGPAS